MHIERIEWLSKEGKEAILTVVNDTKSLVCFSSLCSNNIGDELTEPIECLDTYDIVLSEEREDVLKKWKDHLSINYKENRKMYRMESLMYMILSYILTKREFRVI